MFKIQMMLSCNQFNVGNVLFLGALAGGFRIVPQHFKEYVGREDGLLPNPFEKPLQRIYSRNPKHNSTNYKST